MIDEKKLIERIEKQIDLNTKRYIDNISDEYSMMLDKKIALLKWMINLIKSQPKVNEWISVEERLPNIPTSNNYFDNKPIELYLVDIGDRYPLRAIWNGKIFTDGFCELNVIAWMPLPEPYERKNNDVINNIDFQEEKQAEMLDEAEGSEKCEKIS